MVIDLLFPKNCLVCKRGGAYLCERCSGRLVRSGDVCPQCGDYSFGGRLHGECIGNCELDGLISVWRYDYAMRRIVGAFKYRFAKEVFSDIEYMLSEELKGRRSVLERGVFVPVPLARGRENWRGFNQAQLVAEFLARGFGGVVEPGLLIRKSGGDTQVGLSRSERLRNIRGKYAVNRQKLGGRGLEKRLYVVDDVWTTGATLREAGEVLKRAGFSDVWGFCLARG